MAKMRLNWPAIKRRVAQLAAKMGAHRRAANMPALRRATKMLAQGLADQDAGPGSRRPRCRTGSLAPEGFWGHGIKRSWVQDSRMEHTARTHTRHWSVWSVDLVGGVGRPALGGGVSMRNLSLRCPELNP